MAPSVSSSKPLKIRNGWSVVSRHSCSIGWASSEPWAVAGAGPALWMANAIAGAIATMTNGNATASARTATAWGRGIGTSGEDNSITGNNAKADIDQSDTKRRPANGAIKAGSSSTVQNAVAASRRAGEDGHAMSLTAAPLGRATTATIKSGTAT